MASGTRSKNRYIGIQDSNLDDSSDMPSPRRDISVRPKRLSMRSSKRKLELNSSKKEAKEPSEKFITTTSTLEEVIENEAAKYFAQQPCYSKQKGRKKRPDQETTIPPPPLSLEAVQRSFSEEDPLVEKMKKKHEDSFDLWMLYLVEEINVLLCGFGSKLELLEHFRQRQLLNDDYTHLVVHGYRPDVSVKDLLTVLEDNFLPDQKNSKKPGGSSGLVQRAKAIRDAMNADEARPVAFVLIIHSIDGIGLRDEQQQAALSHLAEINGCRIIASVDHVNASLLWDEEKCTRFRWMWIHAPTYANYHMEIMNGHGSKILGIKKKTTAVNARHTMSGLKSIWSSLNANNRKIFTILAKRQLSAKKGRQRLDVLMSFWDLCNECRQQFISNEAAVREVLNEFCDHNILEKRYNNDDQEVLHISVEDDLLREFLTSEGVDINGKPPAENGDEASANLDPSSDDDSSSETNDGDSSEDEEEKTSSDDAIDEIME